MKHGGQFSGTAISGLAGEKAPEGRRLSWDAGLNARMAEESSCAHAVVAMEATRATRNMGCLMGVNQVPGWLQLVVNVGEAVGVGWFLGIERGVGGWWLMKKKKRKKGAAA